ncbi:hypothetical protein AKUA2103_00830 [Apilactobacillus kunkeei]|uniref:hypothetical protein n=1 Tax=Apilactobacillus kunkeei TaxID=148814 RepID=UPI00110CBE9B|nr:hypothetical protein [Apilactobacillus kunkeei]TMT02867.1 hypothetical protein FD690_01000 [Apilactobacillus kunkeei]CAI2551763.1 hypothetical protein AKUH4B204J_00830 [Apilactobacillus kunkeei]CAI2609053.1 hypothetical protein AKUA2103_00830 [Apilactobacillus kunkeei]CAI2609331.1 hypothetical protein AKUA1003_00830 [Apilactobacillus kunkeei]
MKINYKSSFLAIILTIALFVFAGFTTSHEHTAFASAKSHAAKTYKWTVGVPKELQGKSYYNVSKPYKYYKEVYYVYFGKKKIYFGYLSHGKINFKKHESSYLTGNDFNNPVKYRKSGKNYYLKGYGEVLNASKYRTIGTKTVIIDNVVMKQNKLNVNNFLYNVAIYYHNKKQFYK